MKLEFEEFKGWLGSHLDSEVVGLAGTASECPIANFLNRDLIGLAPTIVGLYDYGFSEFSEPWTELWQALPDWAILFRVRIDALGVRVEVAAQTAYEILREIRPWKSEYLAAGAS